MSTTETSTNPPQFEPVNPLSECLRLAARRGAALRLAALLLDGAIAVERAQAQVAQPSGEPARYVPQIPAREAGR